MTRTDPTTIERIAPARFAGFVATLWRRQGWTVTPTALADRVYVARRESASPAADSRAGDTERRALFAAYRPPGGVVDAAAVRERAAVDLGPDGTTLATNAGFSPDARGTAAAHGVDLVGPDDLARLVDALEAGELLGRPDATTRTS